MGQSNTFWYWVIGIAIVIVVGIMIQRVRRKKSTPADIPAILKEEVKEMPGTEELSIPSEIYVGTSINDSSVDLSKIESMDSDKPFANLKANSVGPAPEKKVTKKKAAKKTTKKIVALNSSTALSAPKKRTNRKKDNTV